MNPLENRNSAKDKVLGAEEIKNLNETKQYTLIATGLLESLITDPNLTASSVKLWEYLYTKAIVNNKLSIKIKYKDLAQKFSRNERTIKRYVENLKAYGYLEVKSNYYQQGQRANTFYLKLPQTVISSIQSTKDRKKPSHTETSDISSHFPDSKIISPDVCNIELDSDNTTTKGRIFTDDKTVILDHDINVLPNNNIKKDIILNNNSVVVDSTYTYKNDRLDSEMSALTKSSLNNEPYVETTTILGADKIVHESEVLRETQSVLDKDNDEAIDEQEIKKLNTIISSLYTKMGMANPKEKISIFCEIQRLQASVTTITVLRTQKNILKPSSHVLGNTAETSSTERPLSNTDTLRIMKGIKSIIVDDNSQKKIFDEISYAIRYGSLRVSQTGELLSISHAINISLKLLREKRWETPAPLKKNMMSSFYHQRDKLPLPVKMYG
jgi:hypothetical protein